jgi:hypothetical protein
MKKVARNFAFSALCIALSVPSLVHGQKGIPKNSNLTQIELAPRNDGLDPIDVPTLNSTELAIEKITLYPNPGKGRVNFSGSNLNNELTIKVISLTGKVVHENHYTAHHFVNNSLDLSYLGKGIYLIQVGETVLKYQKL